MHIKSLSLLLALGLLAGCISRGPLSPDFGYSNQHNAQWQRLDPAAEGRSRPLASSDGQKLEQALKLYRKEKPQQTTTRERVVVGVGGSN